MCVLEKLKDTALTFEIQEEARGDGKVAFKITCREHFCHVEFYSIAGLVLIQKRNSYSEIVLLKLFLIPFGIAQLPQIRLLVHSPTLFTLIQYICIYMELYKDGSTCVIIV